MRRAISNAMLWMLLAAAAAGQQVVDRIVARIEGDILTLSEVRELRGFQELVDGKAVSEAEALDQLIAQWIVATEAQAARFPRPAETHVTAETARLAGKFASPEAYRARLAELGLSEAAVKRLIERGLHLAWYLDYKFRPAVQVPQEEVERYYRESLAPQLAARGETVPPLEQVEERIRKLLEEREISERAARWLDDTKKRLRIEYLGGTPR